MTVLDERPVAIPREIAEHAIRQIAEQDIDGDITAEQAEQRLTRYTGHLADVERASRYSDLKEVIERLDEVENDYDPSQYEPCDRDQAHLITLAREDIRHHIRLLAGSIR